MSDFVREQLIQKTRKAHFCYWCNEIIRPGSRAFSLNGQVDGYFWHGTVHFECFDAIRSCEVSALDGFVPYQQRRGLTQAQSDAACDYYGHAGRWLRHRQKACGRHVLPVELILSPVLGAGAVRARAQGGAR